MRPAARAALVTLGLVACGGPTATPRVPSNTPAAVADAPVAELDGVVVLDPGTGPRRALRYQIVDGTTRHATYHARTTTSGAKPVDIDLTWDYAFARAGDDAVVTLTLGPTPVPVPAGASGAWHLGPRGKHASAPTTNAGRVVLEQTQAEHLLPIVPVAAIGDGARWTVPMGISAGLGEAPLPGQATWTLVSRTDTVAVARATIDMPATEVDVGAGRLTMGGRGTIDVRVDLAAYTATATMTLELTAGDADRATTATIAIDLRIE